MSKHFRHWRIGETQLLPSSVADYEPEGHLSRFIVALLRESLDLKEIKAEVDCWLAAAEAADAEEDTAFGADKRGDEMPDWVADTAKRLAKIRLGLGFKGGLRRPPGHETARL